MQEFDPVASSFPLYVFSMYKGAIVATLCVPKSILASIEGQVTHPGSGAMLSLLSLAVCSSFKEQIAACTQTF